MNNIVISYMQKVKNDIYDRTRLPLYMYGFLYISIHIMWLNITVFLNLTIAVMYFNENFWAGFLKIQENL